MFSHLVWIENHNSSTARLGTGFKCEHVLILLTLSSESCIDVLQTLNCAADDSYIEDESHLRDYLLSDVGVIWRGTARHKVPLTWEFGQVP